MIPEAAPAVATAGLAAWIVLSDAARRRIPNAALLGLVAVWLAGTGLGGEAGALWRGAWALGALLMLGLPAHMAGLVGGGDVKLLAVAVLLTPLDRAWDVIVLFYAAFALHVALVAGLCLLGGSGLGGARRQLGAYPLGVPLGCALGLRPVLDLL